MSAKSEEPTGLLLGFWEAHHKAFKINGISDSKLILLDLKEGGVSFNYYFTDPSTINSQNIIGYLQEWDELYRCVYRLFFPNSDVSYPFRNAEEFILSFVTLFNETTNMNYKMGYIVEIIPSKSYAVVILNYHPGLPVLNQLINSITFDSWSISSLINSQLLISLLEIRDNWREFLTFGTQKLSAFKYFSEKELLRRAASLLLDRWARAINNLTVAQQIALNYFYSSVEKICSMGYEKRLPKGFILVANIETFLIIRFVNFVQLSDYKAARKAIEMTGGNRFALSDGISLYGIGIEDNSSPIANCIKINFRNFNDWVVTYGNSNEISFCVKNDTPRLPRLTITESEFISRLSSRFSGLTVNFDRIYQIVQVSLNAAHGALIVVSSQAREEAHRLRNQATLIIPQILEGEILEGVFSIDGAIMLDLQCTCYAIGVILDGAANNDGDPARGSRYNSSVRYISSINQSSNGTSVMQAAAIVVSEDGHLDII